MITAEQIVEYRETADMTLHSHIYAGMAQTQADAVLTLCDEIESMRADAALGSMVRQMAECIQLTGGGEHDDWLVHYIDDRGMLTQIGRDSNPDDAMAQAVAWIQEADSSITIAE